LSDPNAREHASEQDPEYYAQSAGSGLAAILLFLHIALTGYLGFAMYYVLKNVKVAPELAALPRMLWQYYFPAGMALLSYFPTDPLTRTVARVARAAGAIALLLPVALAVWIAVTASQPTAKLGITTVVMLIMIGCGVAVLLSEWFRLGLTSLEASRRKTFYPINKLPVPAARLVLAMLWAALMLLLASKAAERTTVQFALLAISTALLAARSQLLNAAKQ
jgi:hypothetical protein